MLHAGLAYLPSRFEFDLTLEHTRFSLCEALEVNVFDQYRSAAYIHGGRPLESRHGVFGQALYFGDFLSFEPGRHIAPVDHGVDGLRRKAQHVVSGKHRLDKHIGLAHILVEGVLAEHGYELHNYVAKIIDLRECAVLVRQVDADNNVCAHGPCQVDREVVTGSAVGKNGALRPHRLEKHGDAHRRAHCIFDGAGRPVLGFKAHHISRHAEKRNRQVFESYIVLIPDAKAREEVIDIESVHISGRKGACKTVLAKVTRSAVVDILNLVVDTGLEIFLGVMERYRHQISLAVTFARIRIVRLVDLIRKHDSPVLVPQQRIHVVRIITKGSYASHKAAHTGSADHVDRNALFLQIAQHAHMGRAFGSAAAKDQRYRRPVLGRMNRVHASTHPGNDSRIGLWIHTVDRKAVGILLTRRGYG